MYKRFDLFTQPATYINIFYYTCLEISSYLNMQSVICNLLIAKTVWSKDLVYEVPFGCQVIHHGYSIMSLPEMYSSE